MHSDDFLSRYRSECEKRWHFIFTNGDHCDRYYAKCEASDELLEEASTLIARKIVATLEQQLNPHPIIVPLANGALRLGQMVYTKVLNEIWFATYLPTQKIEGGLVLMDHEHYWGEIFLIEDNVTTWWSLDDVERLLSQIGYQVFQKLCLIDKRISSNQNGNSIDSLAHHPVVTYSQEGVPRHLKSKPICMKYGHGTSVYNNVSDRTAYLARWFTFEV